jgi:hypothetical protein
MPKVTAESPFKLFGRAPEAVQQGIQVFSHFPGIMMTFVVSLMTLFVLGTKIHRTRSAVARKC